MPRIQPIQITDAPDKARQQLEGVQRALGMVPNLFKTLGRSPAALGGYLGFSQALGGALTPPLREQIALAIAGANRCGYCASAHTVLGRNAGVADDELAANLQGGSDDSKTLAALRFARAIVDQRGFISDGDLDDFRAAGYNDAEAVEVVALVALNIFTNYLNHVAQTDIDFPVVDVSHVAV